MYNCLKKHVFKCFPININLILILTLLIRLILLLNLILNFQKLKGGFTMSEISEKLKEKENINKQELINYALGIQLEKIEKYITSYGNDPKFLIREDAENAMTNLIELLKLKKDKKTAKVGSVKL